MGSFVYAAAPLTFVLIIIYIFSSKEINDIVYEVDCQLITVKSGADIDIGVS